MRIAQKMMKSNLDFTSIHANKFVIIDIFFTWIYGKISAQCRDK